MCQSGRVASKLRHAPCFTLLCDPGAGLCKLHGSFASHSMSGSASRGPCRDKRYFQAAHSLSLRSWPIRLRHTVSRSHGSRTASGSSFMTQPAGVKLSTQLCKAPLSVQSPILSASVLGLQKPFAAEFLCPLSRKQLLSKQFCKLSFPYSDYCVICFLSGYQL